MTPRARVPSVLSGSDSRVGAALTELRRRSPIWSVSRPAFVGDAALPSEASNRLRDVCRSRAKTLSCPSTTTGRNTRLPRTEQGTAVESAAAGHNCGDGGTAFGMRGTNGGVVWEIPRASSGREKGGFSGAKVWGGEGAGVIGGR